MSGAVDRFAAARMPDRGFAWLEAAVGIFRRDKEFIRVSTVS